MQHQASYNRSFTGQTKLEKNTKILQQFSNFFHRTFLASNEDIAAVKYDF